MCARLAVLRELTPSGLVSVMPQVWIISTPSFSQYQRIIDGAGAEAPQLIRLRELSFQRPGFASIAACAACQTVGTPAENVTCSASTASSTASQRSGPWK